MRCLWTFSIRLATKLLWDPGAPENLHSYTAIEITAIVVLVLAHPCSTCAFVVVKMHRNVSEFRDRQLAYMPQTTSINASKWVRHMVTVLRCWSPSFETAKLQWDPGIAISYYVYGFLEITAVWTQATTQ
jgi:hypothetical protein